MAGPLDKPIYTPQPPHGSDVASWAYREFIVLSQVLTTPPAWRMAVVNAPPTRPRDGLFAFADGTHWNPSVGRGLYVYNGGWERLRTNVNTPDDAPLPGAWTPYTPTITAAVGTFTTVSGTGRWVQFGKTVHLFIDVIITTVGTASGGVRASLPFNAVSNAVGVGREIANTGKVLGGSCVSSFVEMRFYDNTSPIAAGNELTLSLTYESV